MRVAVQEAARAAVEFWRGGSASGHWEQGDWLVGASVGHDDGCLHVSLYRRENRKPVEGAAITVFPQSDDSELPDEIDEFYSEFLSHNAAVKQTLIKYAFCKLFWPGPDYTELWATAQIAIHVAQRCSITDAEKAWIWTDCLRPLIRLTPAARRADEEGKLGFEVLEALIRNYVNPVRRGGFQAYVRSVVMRLDRESRKKRTAETRTGVALEDGLLERFSAFVRQRKRRGEPGLYTEKGRIVASEEKRRELTREFARSMGRRMFMADLMPKMVELGATEESARRQLRRWLREAGSREGARERFRAWAARKLSGGSTRKDEQK